MARAFPVWTQEETEKLRQNYQAMPIEQLVQLLNKTPLAITKKLLRLTKQKPQEWNRQIARNFWTDWYFVYIQAKNCKNRKRINMQKVRRKRKEREAYSRFAAKQRAWTERDKIILASTYLTRDFPDLLKIFAAKKMPVEIKLKHLLKQDSFSWDGERIEELERQALSFSEEQKAKLRGYYSSLAYFQGRELRRDIDDLLDSGYSKDKAAKILGITKEALGQYAKDRNLNHWYELLKHKRKNNLT